MTTSTERQFTIAADLTIPAGAWQRAGYGNEDPTPDQVAEWLSNALFAGTDHVVVGVRDVIPADE